MGKICQRVPLLVLWAVGAKADEGESATKKQVVRLDLAIAGDSWSREKAGSGQHFPQEQRGQSLQDGEAWWAGMSSCLQPWDLQGWTAELCQFLVFRKGPLQREPERM